MTGRELAATRHAAGLTQAQIAKAAGLHPSAIQHTEKAEHPRPATVAGFLTAVAEARKSQRDALAGRLTLMAKAASADSVAAAVYRQLVEAAEADRKPGESSQAALSRVTRSGPGRDLAQAYQFARRYAAQVAAGAVPDETAQGKATPAQQRNIDRLGNQRPEGGTSTPSQQPGEASVYQAPSSPNANGTRIGSPTPKKRPNPSPAAPPARLYGR
jgi:transcriptional regulator with XRE-family HTH domain